MCADLFLRVERCYVRSVVQQSSIGDGKTPVATEQALLLRLCETGVAGLRPDALESLMRYSWVVPDHRVVFDALVCLRRVPPAYLRDRLPTEATRLGFPDIDWGQFFDSSAASNNSARTVSQLIAEVVSASKHE
jgi:hypothetical protein